MAVMQKNTYKLFHNDQCIVPEGYVEIDEMIAPTIQVLNQKGYTTVFCCAGHPLDDCLWRDAQIETGYRETGIPLRTYIMFAEGITVPCLPPDFETDINTARSQPRLVIEKLYQITSAFENQYYEKMRNILETMKQLYQWALDLPEFKTMNCENEVADN